MYNITNFITIFASLAIAYLIGSINPAIVVTRIVEKKDIRDMGSGNAGMTNVLRSVGKIPAIITTIIDLFKGFIACYIGGYMCAYFIGSEPTWFTIGMYAAGTFAIIGHCFPIYYNFKGGKGVLTSAGVILATQPILLLVVLVVFVIVVAITKYVSLGSIIATIAYVAALSIYFYINEMLFIPTIFFASAMALLVIIKHGGNIKRLIHKEERKISIRKK